MENKVHEGEYYRHFKGNICRGKGWTLSPAFDLNPTLNRYQGIMISRDTNESDLTALLNASEDYFIPREEAWEIIQSVKLALKDWQKTAKRLGVSERDINIFSPPC